MTTRPPELSSEHLAHGQAAVRLALLDPHDLEKWIDQHLKLLNEINMAGPDQPITADTYCPPMIIWWLCYFMHEFAASDDAGKPEALAGFFQGAEMGLSMQQLVGSL